MLFSLILFLPAAFGAEVCIKNVCVKAEVADTPEQLSQGLMFRQKLDENAGMLFILGETSSPAFWMKNMEFPLDIIWISKEKTIVDIYKDAQPCKEEDCLTMEPRGAAAYVLEVNSGFAEKFKIKVGDKVRF